MWTVKAMDLKDLQHTPKTEHFGTIFYLISECFWKALNGLKPWEGEGHHCHLIVETQLEFIQKYMSLEALVMQWKRGRREDWSHRYGIETFRHLTLNVWEWLCFWNVPFVNIKINSFQNVKRSQNQTFRARNVKEEKVMNVLNMYFP